MQYKVPQGIDMQDRILGPFSLMQFGIILFGGLLAYFIFLEVPPPFNMWLAFAVAAITISFTFEYIRRMVTAAFKFFTRPRMRVWHKASSQTTDAMIEAPQVSKKDKKLKEPDKAKKVHEVSKLAEILDTRGRKE